MFSISNDSFAGDWHGNSACANVDGPFRNFIIYLFPYFIIFLFPYLIISLFTCLGVRIMSH